MVKFRHAASLALVGWYLMIPPHLQTSSLQVDRDAPISRWKHYRSFDSATECEATLERLRRDVRKIRTDNPATTLDSEAAQEMMGKCIASDDSRLRER